MHSPLLNQYLIELQSLKNELPILDLACGSGRNGLFCLEQQLPVTFADINQQALNELKQTITHEASTFDATKAAFWQVDFEQGTASLIENNYGAVMVFRYLHRPLIEKIKASVVAGGLVIYETFTIEQAQLGRPKNPDFLLKAGELANYFSDWKILHSFEGIKDSDTGDNKQAVAQIIARKPTNLVNCSG